MVLNYNYAYIIFFVMLFVSCSRNSNNNEFLSNTDSIILRDLNNDSSKIVVQYSDTILKLKLLHKNGSRYFDVFVLKNDTLYERSYVSKNFADTAQPLYPVYIPMFINKDTTYSYKLDKMKYTPDIIAECFYNWKIINRKLSDDLYMLRRENLLCKGWTITYIYKKPFKLLLIEDDRNDTSKYVFVPATK